MQQETTMFPEEEWSGSQRRKEKAREELGVSVDLLSQARKWEMYLVGQKGR